MEALFGGGRGIWLLKWRTSWTIRAECERCLWRRCRIFWRATEVTFGGGSVHRTKRLEFTDEALFFLHRRNAHHRKITVIQPSSLLVCNRRGFAEAGWRWRVTTLFEVKSYISAYENPNGKRRDFFFGRVQFWSCAKVVFSSLPIL